MTDGSRPIESGAKPWTDRELLRDLYHEQGLSQREIADNLGCGVGTVSTHMNRLGIETRDSSQFKGGDDQHPRWVPWASFYTTANGYEVSQARYGHSTDVVKIHQLVAIAEGADPNLLFKEGYHVHHKNHIPWDNRHCNLEVLEPGIHRILHHAEENKPWRDKETLEQYFESGDYSVKEIADELGCRSDTISKWGKRFGLENKRNRLPCGHSGFTNLESGDYSCANSECGREYDRSTIESVFL